MSREVTYVDGTTPVAADWLNYMQEVQHLGAWGLHLDTASGTQVRVAASADEQVGIVVNGKMRVATADKTLTISGAAGIYNVFATADTSDRAFTLAFSALAIPPAVTNYRKIGEVTWDGSAIKKVKNTWSRSVQQAEERLTGDFVWSARSAALVGELQCSGQVLAQALYPDLFAKIGTAFNLGGETGSQFRLPSADGRGLIAAGNGSGLTARTRGQRGGAETHQLTVAEMPTHRHPEVFYNGGASAGTAGFQGSGSTPNWAQAAGGSADAGGNGAHNNMPPWISGNLFIKL